MCVVNETTGLLPSEADEAGITTYPHLHVREEAVGHLRIRAPTER